MPILINIDELVNYSSREKIPFSCERCNSTFYRKKNKVCSWLKGTYSIKYCSPTCKEQHEKTGKEIPCKWCGKIKYYPKALITKNRFCSKSCAAKYNNTHKTTGTRRSKLEKWIEDQLTILYPNLEIHYNKTNAINGELDIYIPSLKLAFELNGIFHYEPIYGTVRLSQIQNNDKRKFQACLEKEIELCVIDTQCSKHFKPKRDKKFLDIIISLIQSKLQN